MITESEAARARDQLGVTARVHNHRADEDTRDDHENDDENAHLLAALLSIPVPPPPQIFD